ncbi:MAG: hypothetical protein IJ679_00315, partial [Lachnospiraceae bacterium]|nr:hypothetical protein [Lachnospiraceae bacterium]
MKKHQGNKGREIRRWRAGLLAVVMAGSLLPNYSTVKASDFDELQEEISFEEESLEALDEVASEDSDESAVELSDELLSDEEEVAADEDSESDEMVVEEEDLETEDESVDAEVETETEDESADALDADTTWQSSYTYELDDDEMEIYLESFKGSETNLVVPAIAVEGGRTYRTVLGRLVYEDNESLKSIKFEDGVQFGEYTFGQFSGCSA